jgi:HlyD family secretion protein
MKTWPALFAPIVCAAALAGCGRGVDPNAAAAGKTATITRGTLVSQVVDNGTIEAVKSVEVKSRVSGRLARLVVEEGDVVRQGQLIAVVDPKETALKVAQDRAQLAGARSAADRSSIEIAQRRISAAAEFRQAKARLGQMEAQMRAQPTLTTAAIQEAEAELNRNLRERENLQRSTHPNARTTAESALSEAQANLQTSTAEYERQRQLLEKGYVSQREVESAKLAMDLAKVRVESAKQSVSRLDEQFRNEMSRATEAIRQSEAALRRARANSIQNSVRRNEYLSAVADVEKARAALSDVASLEKTRDQNRATVQQISAGLQDSERLLGETEIRAPLSGVVTKKFVQEGELVASLSSFSSGTTIVKIEDRASMKVKLNVNEIDVAKLREGMTAKITVDALPDKVLEGTVKKIAPASNEPAGGQAASADAVVKYLVEIWIRNVDQRLRSGMSAKCTLEVLRRDNALILPLEFLGKDGARRFVTLAPTKGVEKATPTKHWVTVGASTGSQVEILSGVTEGAVVQRPDYKGPERKGMMQMGKDEGG